MHKLKVPEWCCAIRFNNDGENIIDGSSTKFVAIKDPYRYWTADPFLFEKDGILYVFVEMFDRIKRKGLIGYRKIVNGKIGNLNIAYEGDCHLSYPLIYEEDGNIYIIPESSKGRKLVRLKATNFPDKWEEELLRDNDRLVDTTMLQLNSEKYYFSERVLFNNRFDRVDLFYDVEGELIECKNNPVKIDPNNARGAGRVFKYNDMLLRPAQNCGKDYGEKLNFNKIINLSREELEEELYKTISIEEVKIDKPGKYIGIHTYNSLGNVEVIDLKTSDSFNALNVAGGILKRARLYFK